MPRKIEDWTVKHLSQLKGKTVKAINVDDQDDRVYGLEFEDGTTAWILCDPEGNGPGFLDIQEG